jgi:hypothetical protein
VWILSQASVFVGRHPPRIAAARLEDFFIHRCETMAANGASGCGRAFGGGVGQRMGRLLGVGEDGRMDSALGRRQEDGHGDGRTEAAFDHRWFSGGQMDSLMNDWTNVMANKGNLSIRQKLLLPRPSLGTKASVPVSSGRPSSTQNNPCQPELAEQHESQHLIVQSSCLARLVVSDLTTSPCHCAILLTSTYPLPTAS